MDSPISESDFFETWGASVSPGGDLLTFEAVKDLDMHRVWTVVECDDDAWMAEPGFHLVNRLGYVTTTRPWVSGSELAYYAEPLDDPILDVTADVTAPAAPAAGSEDAAPASPPNRGTGPRP